MFDFEKNMSRIAEQTILCIGDLMLDDFVYGEVSRVSPEAPAPVLAVRRSEEEIGGAGNVARNIAALGARCIFVGLTGEDDAGERLARAFADEANIVAKLVVDPGRPTTRKVRYVSEHYSTHLLRADWELSRPASAEVEDLLIASATDALPRVGAVVLSDYAKGVLTPRVVRAVIEAARRQGRHVVVDPKGHDFAVYRGATVITPNRKELAEATRRSITADGAIAQAAAELARAIGCDAVLVTRSEDGMTLHVEGHAPMHVPAYPVRVRDVSGAGDTVAAALAVLLSLGADFESAARAANAAAAVVVGKRGTAAVSAAELRHRILPAAARASEEKIVFDFVELDERLAEWRRQGQRVGFTNGHFDLLHPGHIKVLAEARAHCDRLVVGLNSDASTKRLKGESRPINSERARAEVLAALEAVDLVVIFEDDTPQALIERVRPSVLVKGGDYRRDQVVGREVVEAAGGEVILVETVPGHSTTAMVTRASSKADAPS